MALTRAHELLEECIAATPGGAIEVAYRLGCSVSSLHYVRHGSVPRAARRKAIAKWSAGVVPVSAWEEPARSLSPAATSRSRPPHRAA